MDWARAAPVSARSQDSAWAWLGRVSGGLIDWETVITFVLLLGAITAVSAPLEDGGWRRDMPALTTVSVVSALTAMLLARSRLSAFLAWPVSVLVGAAAVFWQSLVMVGPGTLAQRLDAVYYRFEAWFNILGTDQVTNDPLPFNVLIISLTWLGVALFVWSVFRWHNAWLGLIPGGVALFLDLTLVGDDLTGAIVLYMLFGFLLVMQTNLLANIRRWRREDADYPRMINLTFLNFSAWALVVLMIGAWVAPAGLSTPRPVQSVVEETLEFGAKFVRLAGPLHSNKVIPIHSYSGTLPFQGSIKLGDREIMSVIVADGGVEGTLPLRGAVYDYYQSGGWQMGDRREVTLPVVDQSLLEGEDPAAPEGTLVPLVIEMEAKTVAGTVIYTPGQPVAASRNLAVQVPAESAERKQPLIPFDGARMTDEEVALFAAAPDELVVRVERDAGNRVEYIEVVSLNEFGLLGDSALLDPGERIKRHRSYAVTGFIPNVTEDELRAAGPAGTLCIGEYLGRTDCSEFAGYPEWVTQIYTQLPLDSLPERVYDLAEEWTEGADTTYDKAIAIRDRLHTDEFTYSTDVEEPPAGRDFVDYFLYDSKEGYFHHHASAMVVMLRTLGIPSRLAVGFVVNENDREADGRYHVKDENSYAWPEVYFPGYGWVAFNPTPDRSVDLSPEIVPDSEIAESDLDKLYENLPYSGVDNAFLPVDDTEGLINPPAAGSFTTSGGGGERLSWWAGAAVVAFIAALAGAIVMGWQRSVSGLPYPQQLWEKTVRLASWGGLPPEPGQTPHDYAKRLGKRLHVREFPALADAYTKSRFGHRDLGAEEAAQLKVLWPDIRAALFGSIAGRLFRRRRGSAD